MEFRLVYDGRMPSGQSKKGVSEKHAIRRVFHRQLKNLWHEHPALKRFVSIGGREQILGQYERGGFNFLPLITQQIGGAYAELEMTFLRRDHPGSLIRHGDIDNRLKTLFDSLKVPEKGGGSGQPPNPEEDERPFYCLLEDDSLITSVKVTTDRLLTTFIPTTHSHPLDDTMIIIHVKTGTFAWKNWAETFW